MCFSYEVVKPQPNLDKIGHLQAKKLGISGPHFRTPVPHWIDFSLRETFNKCLAFFNQAIMMTGFVGACAMTTKFLYNKICTFKILLSWHFAKKKRFGRFSSLPAMPPPSKPHIYFHCRLAFSEFGGFQSSFFFLMRGWEISIIGVVRAPVAIMKTNYVFCARAAC